MEQKSPSKFYLRKDVVSLETEKITHSTDTGRRPKGKQVKIGPFRFEHWQIISILLAIYDYVAITGSYFIALWSRFDGVFSAIPKRYLDAYSTWCFPFAAVCIVIFYLFRMYRSMWRYASLAESARIVFASMTTVILHTVGITVFVMRMPISYYIVGAILQFIFLLLPRFAYRFMNAILKRVSSRNSDGTKRVMLIGAGSAGQMILRELLQAREITERVVCIIDDNPNKWNRFMEGIPVVGGRDDILYAVKKYSVEKIYFAIPSATAQQKRDILMICNETGCELKQLPGIYQFMLDRVSITQMKKVSVEDLLGREPIRTDMAEVYAFVSGKVVLVTGGGGSIGSELCRQIAAHTPKQLIIFDVYENNAYSIQLELQRKYPELNLVTLIGSVRDSRRIFQVFRKYQPQIVYHAAAHKHVPLMEDSPCEAIKNNALGTYKTAYAAMVNHCERFVLISTDKAVNPTNVMGASKRICEMIIQSFDHMIKQGKAAEIPQLFTHAGYENADREGNGHVFQDIKTEFVAVRFGNVLGSNGSVIPLFREQIERGGPITVTHPDIIRYFMTIPEAVSLVMLAGTYAHGGEIFVLDMGSPVKIDSLARNMIKLSGYRPDVDIKIEYTGLRPGEKLYEEKLMAEEGLKKTDNELIHIGCPIPFDEEKFLNQLALLMDAAYSNKESTIREQIAGIVSTYRPEDITPRQTMDGTYQRLVHEADQ
ncbi:polysaccharide biosynthesis protein [Clostridiales bacterium]|nr:polysaccharide biosynthesis protein [Clostridiales bacterium]